MIYLDALSYELSQVGIRGRRRRRILTEIEDHLACDPEAQLGSPAQVAGSFAEQLGSSFARRAALWAFAALAVAGAMFAATFLAARGVNWPQSLPYLHPRSRLLGNLGLALALLCPQVALVAGSLGAVRAQRLRREAMICRNEAAVLTRRAGVGLIAGAGSVAGLALLLMEFGSALPGWWRVLAIVAVALGGAALVCAMPALRDALRVRPLREGDGGDIFDDLPSFVRRWLGDSPWMLAFLTAGGIGLFLAFTGALQDDPFDGIARGLLDALACLAGFATLGRFIGLWAPARAEH
jgi:hypothetical protein